MSDRGAALSYAVAVAIGLALVAVYFPLEFILAVGDPARVADLATHGDQTTHAIGQRFFLHEPWGWPLLWVHGIEPPGVPLGFMDAIPLIAVPLKLMRSILPPEFHGIGLWYALAWLLQPVAATFCIRAAGERRFLPVLAFTIVAACMPAWWARYGHASLTGHFLLLLSLGLYFRLLQPAPLRAWGAAALLLIAALLVHPYLMVMALGVIAAAPATLLVRAIAGGTADPGEARRGAGQQAAAQQGAAQQGTAQAILIAAGIVVVVGLLAWTLGYAEGQGGGFYGLFGMNLLSPVWPFRSGLLPNPPGFIVAPGMVGAEAYNWLGAGVILALAAGLLLMPRLAWQTLRRHAGLALALLGLLCLAVGTRVTLGPRLLADLGLPPELVQQFRASGRFFWPVAYALALIAVLLMVELRPKGLAIAALVVLPLVQWLDVAPLRQRLAALVRAEHVPVAEAEALRAILPGASAVNVYPLWACWTPDRQDVGSLTLGLLGVASLRAVPIENAYVARNARLKGCPEDRAKAATPLAPGEVRIVTTPDDPAWADIRPAGPHACARVGRTLFCRLPSEALPGDPAPARKD